MGGQAAPGALMLGRCGVSLNDRVLLVLMLLMLIAMLIVSW